MVSVVKRVAANARDAKDDDNLFEVWSRLVTFTL